MSLILHDLLARRGARTPRPQGLYWRTASGHEADFVIERGDELIGVEVEASGRPRIRDIRFLQAFRDEYPDRVRGCLLLLTRATR